MIIRFFCPRGHKMGAPAEKAGSMGKCPQCETLLEVPTPPAGYNGVEVLQADEVLEFYCPNEHYLRSPARLQGKRGQCPHCGEKFVVPSLEEDSPEPQHTAAATESGEVEGVGQIEEVTEEQETIEEIETIDDSSDPTGGSEAVEDIQTLDDEPEHGSSKSGGGSSGRLAAPDFSFVEKEIHGTSPGTPAAPVPHAHPLAALFERIWEESDREAVVELELKTGERIAPLHYAHDVSRGQFGVFAVRAHNGTHTVTVVAWDDVARITVKDLNHLPPTMFN